MAALSCGVTLLSPCLLCVLRATVCHLIVLRVYILLTCNSLNIHNFPWCCNFISTQLKTSWNFFNAAFKAPEKLGEDKQFAESHFVELHLCTTFRLLMQQWLLIAPCCHSTSSNWRRSSWWRKRPRSGAANYTMCDRYLLQTSLDSGSIQAKPRGLPRCVCQLVASVQISSLLPLTNYPNKQETGHFICLLRKPPPCFRAQPHCVGCNAMTTDWKEMTLHQKSIYSWFFTLPQKCRCTVAQMICFRTFNTSA